MAVFISTITSPFEDTFERQSERTSATRNVRRPLRGLEMKKDTYATIKVVDALNRPIPFVDSSAPPAEDGGTIGQSTEYSNFILQAVQEQRVEKQQIVETFGEDYIFFFGERPRIYTFNALLINARNFNWKNEWWKNYEEVLRGTKLLERNARMYLYYDDVVVEGYMLQAQASTTVDDPHKLPLTFQVFCTNYAVIGDVGSIFTPLANPQEEEAPSSFNAEPSKDAQAAAIESDLSKSGGGSLLSFLSDAARFANDATFTVQRKLQQMKNTLHGVSVAYPNRGIGNQVYLPPIENQGTINPPGARQRVPIWQQFDEYTSHYENASPAEYDKAEADRVKGLLRLRSPQELENKARAHLSSLGVQVGHTNGALLLMGRAAFAGTQTIGTFGVTQVEGSLNTQPATGVTLVSEGL